jgi:hypothetical protein
LKGTLGERAFKGEVKRDGEVLNYNFGADFKAPPYTHITTITNHKQTAEVRVAKTLYKNIIKELLDLVTKQDIEEINKAAAAGKGGLEGVSHTLPEKDDADNQDKKGENSLKESLKADQKTAEEKAAEKDGHVERLNQAAEKIKNEIDTFQNLVRKILEDMRKVVEIIRDQHNKNGKISDLAVLKIQSGEAELNPEIFEKKVVVEKEEESVLNFNLVILTDNSGSMSGFRDLTYQTLVLIQKVFENLKKETTNSTIHFAKVGTEVSEFNSEVQNVPLNFDQGTEAFKEAFEKTGEILEKIKTEFAKQIVIVITDGQFTGDDVDEIIIELKEKGVTVMPLPINSDLLGDFAESFKELNIPQPEKGAAIDIAYIFKYIEALIHYICPKSAN